MAAKIEAGKGKLVKAEATTTLKPVCFKFERETKNTLVFSEILPDGSTFDPKARGGERQHVIGTIYVDKAAGFTPDSILSVTLTDIAEAE